MGIAHLILLGVYIRVSVQQKKIPLWALPGLGTIVPGIMGSPVILRPFDARPPDVMNQAVDILIMVLALAIFGVLIVWGAHFARRERSSVAILLVLPGLFAVILSLLDPTYAWIIYWPDARLWSALTEGGIASIPSIILPIMVLRGERSAPINRAVAGLSLLTMELAVAAHLVRDVGAIQQLTAGAPTLAESIQHILTVDQVMIGIMLLPVAGLLWLYTWQGRGVSEKN
jgi:hypothetical protein